MQKPKKRFKEMSTFVNTPEFMSDVFPYMVRTDDYVVNIRPLDYDNAVMYFTDVKGSVFDIPIEINIHSFEYENKGSINQSIVEKDLTVEPGTKYFQLKMENSYIIHYKDYIVLEGGKSVNGRLYEIGDLFDYPPTDEDREVYNASIFTSIVRASVTKDSDLVKVSSTMGIEIEKMVEGQGIPENTWIMAVDFDDLTIRMSQPATETLSNITLNISEVCPEYEEIMYE
jgi:hypothetical protein